MSELANNKSIRKEVNDLGETLGITPKGNNNQQKIRSIGEQASDGTYATKEYVNTLMSGALKRAIVETLPVEDIDTNTIYMVLDQSASQQGNVYNEYLYINNAWELIGTTDVAETVIANPTLAGTEANLTGLLVGDTKYKVPQGGGGSQLYTLHIYYDDVEYPKDITCIVDDNTIETYSDLANYLKTKGFVKTVSASNEDRYILHNASGYGAYSGAYIGLFVETESDVDTITVMRGDGIDSSMLSNDENFSITYLGNN